jgi:hypothetical protein
MVYTELTCLQVAEPGHAQLTFDSSKFPAKEAEVGVLVTENQVVLADILN